MYRCTRGRSPLLVLLAGYLGSGVVSAGLPLPRLPMLAASLPGYLAVWMAMSHSPFLGGQDRHSYSSSNTASFPSMGRQGQGVRPKHYICCSQSLKSVGRKAVALQLIWWTRSTVMPPL